MLEFSNDFLNGKTKTAGEDQYFVERKKITQKGLLPGDFVEVKDGNCKRRGILRSSSNKSDEIDWIDFTTTTGQDVEESEFACEFDGQFKRVIPAIIGLKVSVKHPEDNEILGVISEDKEGNLLFLSKKKNNLVDNYFIQGHKYSCILLDKNERRIMEQKCFGRIKTALNYIGMKNFGYKFIKTIKKDKE